MEAFTARLDELLGQGQALVSRMPLHGAAADRAAPAAREPEYRAWLASSANIITALTPSTSPLRAQCEHTLADSDLRYRVPTRLAQQMLGLLAATKADFEAGVLRQVEYVLAGATFDDFLDHASAFHKGGRKIEAAVLASAVLEDTLKRIAKRNAIATAGLSIEQVLDALRSSLVITETKAKRIRSYAAVRNHADHAEWEQFDLSDVGGQIAGIRQLIDEYLR